MLIPNAEKFKLFGLRNNSTSVYVQRGKNEAEGKMPTAVHLSTTSRSSEFELQYIYNTNARSHTLFLFPSVCFASIVERARSFSVHK